MKTLIVALVFLCGSLPVFSQGFTFTRTSPAIVVSNDTTDSEIVSYGLLQVPSGTLNIRIIRTIENLSTGWDTLGTAMCNYQNCFSNTTDSVTAPYGTATSDDTLSFHFYCYAVPPYVYVPGAGSITIRAELVSNPSQFIEQSFGAATSGFIGIQQISSIVKEFKLSQNYPNPFNPTTKINFSIPKSDYVSLRVYDMLGREVKVLVNGPLTAGEYETDFDAKGLSSGMYYYSLRSGDYVDVKKMVLVK
ncbi:MAG: T9SS type A sorting domain-containing protein [Ignavibacteria bacterium]|nr:T9SS type A sorting domain-containing protein [Ignavibacteria bacterium]